MGPMPRSRLLSAACLVAALLLSNAAALAQASIDTWRLGGVWDATVDGRTSRAQLDAWEELYDARLTLSGKTYRLARTGDATLAGAADGVEIELTIESLDRLSGRFPATGKSIVLWRNKSVRKRATIRLPKDRTFYRTMKELIAPAVNADRDSYFYVDPEGVRYFVRGIERFYWGWARSPLLPDAPDDAAAEEARFDAILQAIKGYKVTPRYLLSNRTFQDAVAAALPEGSDAIGRWVVNYGSFIAIGSGRGPLVIMDERPWPVGRGSKFWLLSNRAEERPELTAYMRAPGHYTLPTTFGQWLKTIDRMPKSDDANFYRHLLEVLARSDTTRIALLSSQGQTASTDFVGITSAELYCAVEWGVDVTGWPLDMIGLALNSAFVRASGKVITPDAGWEWEDDLPIAHATLRPGPAYYYDHMDMINYGQGSRFLLQRLCTRYMREAHPETVARLEGLLPVPASEVRSPNDLIERIARSLMDDRMSAVNAQAFIDAAATFIAEVQADAPAIVGYIRAQGVRESATSAVP